MEKSSTIKVSIKWGKQVFNDVELDLSEDITLFKSQIYALSNVPVEKQKVMAKGKIIKDENGWAAYPALKDGIQLMLMGTAEGKELQDPSKMIKFVEDMTPEEKAAALKAKTGVAIPAGLENLGNTCYMNSVMQSFKRVNELKSAIKDFELDDSNRGMAGDPSVALTSSAKGLMNNLDGKGESFAPFNFVQTMRTVFPMFDERDDKSGQHK